MFLNSGKEIAERIKFLINEEVTGIVKLAVAFWGTGADYQLRGACQVICDLESGACNPAVIRALLKRNNCVVLKLAGLHAKVVISSAGAVISSANMSTNGLGAEGADASGTIEAGYFVPQGQPDHEKISLWFDGILNSASEITELDLVKAEAKWEFRNREMPTTTPIALELDISPSDLEFSTLLEDTIDPKDRLRAVKKDVLNLLSDELPEVDHRRLGKVATWASHLILNRAGMNLDHSAGDGEEAGPATDQWIVSRFGTEKRKDTSANVEILLKSIRRNPFFPSNIRHAANQVLLASPWMEHD